MHTSGFRHLLFIALIFLLSGCETAYYSAWEKLGVHKRDILIDRIEETQEAQKDGQEQFKSALEQFKSVVQFDGGELEVVYEKMSAEYEASESASNAISEHIDAVESVAEALFEEWEVELEQYSNASLRSSSQKQLASTRREYQSLLRAMHRAEDSIKPVLDTLRDNTLYLKHNLNARAIAAIRGELGTVNRDVDRLLQAMQTAIAESDQFISKLKGQ